MRKLLTFILLLAATTGLSAQNQPETYRLFDAKGKPIAYSRLVKELATQDVVFFGEMHNCPITHWLEYKLLESLCQAHDGKIDVGMEMLEADNQLIIDEYMAGVISESQFEDECRLWPNYSTDYKPLVDFAHEHRLGLIATNIPRRYASIVKNRGLVYLDSLSQEARAYMPPLPIPYESNPQANAAFGIMSSLGKGKKANSEYLGQSQGLKDATMGWNIARRWRRPLIHFNGNYHSDSNDGIIKYLRKYRPNTKLKTVYSVKQEDISSLDSTYLGHGDYYICIPEDMVRSY